MHELNCHMAKSPIWGSSGKATELRHDLELTRENFAGTGTLEKIPGTGTCPPSPTPEEGKAMLHLK